MGAWSGREVNVVNDAQDSKKVYTAPELEEFGKIADLTQTGLTNPGDDLKNGSVASQGV